MIYLKSFLAGLVALGAYVVVIVLVLYFSIDLLVPRPQSLPPNVGYISNSQWVFVSVWPIIGGAVLVFAVAFYWTFRRVARRQA